MYYPNKAQWWVIWLTVLWAVYIIVIGYGWIGAYRRRELVIAVLLAGSLLAWQMARPPEWPQRLVQRLFRRKRTQAGTAPHEHFSPRVRSR